MALGKVGTKNDPGKRNKGITSKTYMGKNVKPVKYVGRKEKCNYMSAIYEDGNVVEDSNGDPLAWSSI